MKKPIFMCLVGACASGKSTYAKQYADECVLKVFSSDDYREKMFGDRKDQTHNKEIWAQLYKDLRAALEAGEDCLLDATNCTIKSRLKCIEALKGVDCIKIASIISTDAEACIKRNKNRKEEDQVPEEVVYKFIKGFEVPLPWEGWDRIYFQGYDTDFCPKLNERCRELALKSMENHCQHNPHHIHTTKKHCELAAEQFDESERVLRSAALFHDISKALGKWVGVENEEQGVTHYYNHANASCHYMLQNLEAFDCQTWDEVYECLWLIQSHMLGKEMVDPESKVHKKWVARVGEKWVNDLLHLVKADEIACGNPSHEYHAEISEKIKSGYYKDHQEELVPEEYVEPEKLSEEPVQEMEEKEPSTPQEENQVASETEAVSDQPVAPNEFSQMSPMGGFGGMVGMMGMLGAMMGGLGGANMLQEVKEEDDNANTETERNSAN